MARIADVFINLPIKSITKAYSYLLPESLAFLEPGWRVIVPFGGRRVEGFIAAVREDEPQAAEKLKEVAAAVDEEAWFYEKMTALAYWMAQYYLCSVGEAMRLFMPGKSGSKITPVYMAASKSAERPPGLTPERAALYAWVAAHPRATAADVYRAFPKESAAADLQYLHRGGWLDKQYRSEKMAAPKLERHFDLARPLTQADWESFARRPAQLKLLRLLQTRGETSAAELKSLGVGAHALQEAVKADVVRVLSRRVLRDSYRRCAARTRKPLVLSAEQSAAVQSIGEAVAAKRRQIFLLHGVTGSGKTQVYIEMARSVRRAGKNVIVLVPEIALTSQMIRQFQAYFPEEVIVMHSRLSIGERNDAILKIRRGEAAIVIGARSALFTPVDNIGAIIMDEEHDASYKQDESPRYHTRDVALHMAKLHQAVLVLGSATPALESYAAAQNGQYTLLPLPRRIGETSLPLVEAVDMRRELKRGRRGILSEALKRLIAETLAKGEQVILMLNRRGFSTFVMCRECGHVIACPQCTLPLVYHQDGTLQCHYCDSGAPVPDVCPKCSSRYIKYFGSGTERLASELAQVFPGARTIRMDRDTTGKKFAHAQILTDFAAKKYDILLGTQMVAKGHDIQNVTAVGIISADSSLNLPDFRAAERCFALITQAAGRAGRGSIRGKVVVQTYNPEHYAVMCALRQDYCAFYREEIALRRQLMYPPYGELLKIIVQHAEESGAKAAAAQLAQNLRDACGAQQTKVLGPAASAVPKLREIYRYTLLVQSRQIETVKQYLRGSGLYLRMDLIIDVNPLNVL